MTEDGDAVIIHVICGGKFCMCISSVSYNFQFPLQERMKILPFPKSNTCGRGLVKNLIFADIYHA